MIRKSLLRNQLSSFYCENIIPYTIKSLFLNYIFLWILAKKCNHDYNPAPRRWRRVYCFTSVRPSKIFFVAFFSVIVDGRYLIFGHKHHIGMPYCGKRFWTRQIPTSCLPTLLISMYTHFVYAHF